MILDSEYQDFLDFWMDSTRPMTAYEAAVAFVEEYQITDYQASDLADRYYSE
jgi:hypothetical protein